MAVYRRYDRVTHWQRRRTIPTAPQFFVPRVRQIPLRGRKPDLSHPQLRGCVGWWPMFEGAGLLIRDYSGYGHHGTAEGTTTAWQSSARGRALFLDGTNGGVNCGGAAFFDQFVGDLTIMAWVFHVAASAADIVVSKGQVFNQNCPFALRHTPAANHAIVFEWNSGSGSGDEIIHNNVLLGTWAHVVGRRSSTQGWVFRDGILVTGPQATSKTPTASGNDLWIGNQETGGSSGPYDGAIQDVRIYNRQLSETEIRWIIHDPWAAFATRPEPVFFVPAAPTGGPAPFHIRNRMLGGMVELTGGVNG